MKLVISLAATLALLGETNAFSPKSIQPLPTPQYSHTHGHAQRSSTKLNSHALNNEEDAVFLMAKASACAHSDTCSLEDAQEYLDEILHIQSNCASGAFSSHEICEDIAFPTEVVASLREKIENGKSMSALNVGPLFLTIAAAYILGGVYTMQNPGVDAFTPQEWMWSIRDGYFPDMISQFVKHGGLAPAGTDTIVPFTLQEWGWAIRDGYLNDMVSQSIKNGGLEFTPAQLDGVVATPFTAEEWKMSMHDGYLNDMISHYMKNGGL